MPWHAAAWQQGLACLIEPWLMAGLGWRRHKQSHHTKLASPPGQCLPAVDSLRKQVAVLKGQLSRDRVLRSMQA